MNPIAVMIVLISSFFHAYWNFFLKKIINKGGDEVVVYWLSSFAGVAFYFPLFLVLLKIYGADSYGILLSAICGLFFALYIYTLGKSYEKSDLSHAYPLSKITPLFTLLIGFFILEEKISFISFAGIILVVFAVYSMHLKNFRNLFSPVVSLSHKGSIFAVLTALISAIYGLISKLGVAKINPFVFLYLAYLFAVIFYLPLLRFTKSPILLQFNKFKKEIISIGIIDIFTYGLVLFALKIENLSSVFAFRQVSMLFSVLLGVYIFKESYGKMRIISSFILLVGICLISIA